MSPIQPVPDQNGPGSSGQSATTPGQPGEDAVDGPGSPTGTPAPAGPMSQGPVAFEDAGPAPETGAPAALGPGPGGDESGIANIPPEALGPEYDPTVTPGEDMDLGPAPEASDPGTMGPAPEDSGR